MIIVKLKGGLGNQMFQYAFGKSLSILTGKEFFIDISGFSDASKNFSETPRQYELDVFDLKLNLVNSSVLSSAILKTYNTRISKVKQLLGLTGASLVISDNTEKWENRISSANRILLDGYFQGEKFFRKNADCIREDFRFKLPSDPANLALHEKIKGTASVAIHVRRGDYISNPGAAAFHGVCSPEYYLAAIDLLNRKFPDLKYFVFSDDPEWCKIAFKDFGNIEIVELNQQANLHLDMWHISSCRHQIISNSSFSWWGAWLAEHPDKMVIAPRQWFKDQNNPPQGLLPETWIQL